MTAEPRMEDLLASIRKAIQDDIGEVPASTSATASGSLYKSSTRELHVSMSSEPPSASTEIQELRERINRSRLEAPRESVFGDMPEAPALPDSRRHRGADGPQAPLRASFAEQDLRTPAAVRSESFRRQDRDLERIAQPSGWREADAQRIRPAAEGWQRPETAMLSADAAHSAGAAFQRLADSILSRATSDRSVEDMTRELLRGMLKQWLDENLPALVESLVREEIERVARRGR